MTGKGKQTTSLTLKGVTTGHKGFTIPDIGLSLQRGDILGLVGRSGSGKSTVLDTLVGTLKPRAGTMTFVLDGETVPLRLHAGYSPQKNALYPFLTVKENLRTFAQIYGVPRKEREERIAELLDRLDLTRHGDKRITQLSGGMEKRADIAASLVHDPDVLILDEPFTGLDISLQRFIWNLLRELAAQGRIIIITSHLLDDIQRYCTRFALVENGRFYDDDAIRAAVKRRGLGLQQFLEQMFTRDLVMGAQR